MFSYMSTFAGLCWLTNTFKWLTIIKEYFMCEWPLSFWSAVSLFCVSSGSQLKEQLLSGTWLILGQRKSNGGSTWWLLELFRSGMPLLLIFHWTRLSPKLRVSPKIFSNFMSIWLLCFIFHNVKHYGRFKTEYKNYQVFGWIITRDIWFCI